MSFVLQKERKDEENSNTKHFHFDEKIVYILCYCLTKDALKTL